jgi:hypothetical protein
LVSIKISSLVFASVPDIIFMLLDRRDIGLRRLCIIACPYAFDQGRTQGGIENKQVIDPAMHGIQTAAQNWHKGFPTPG